MPHIALGNDAPGIRGLFLFRPETGRPLQELAQALLRGPSPLTTAERETIAAFVSSGNGCNFCYSSHVAAARALAGADAAAVDAAIADPTAATTPKMAALLAVAAEVRKGGKAVGEEHVRAARGAGASDVEIHDAVLVAAAFCMFNRYVDGLGTDAPPAGSPAYAMMGEMLATKGYVR